MGYQRSISLWSMLWCAVSAILGSGWLFGSYLTSQLAGPSAVVAWVMGAFMVLVVAFTLAEISTLAPVSGGSARFPGMTHGYYVGLVLGWVGWLGVAILPAVEAQAVIQYLDIYYPSLVQVDAKDALTGQGYVFAIVLLFLMSIINVFSVRWVMRLNNVLSIWKVLVPLVVSIVLICFGFHAQNFTGGEGHFFSNGFAGVCSAISLGGVVFSFNGFKQAIDLAGEAEKPSRVIPIALVGSIGLCLLLYLLLQVAFIGALLPQNLSGGWQHLHLDHAVGPLAAVIAGLGMTGLVFFLYTNAITAPVGAGLVYTTSSPRIFKALCDQGMAPKKLGLLSPRGIPVRAVIINFLLCVVFFMPFPGWEEMAAFISSLMVFGYTFGPVCLLTFREQLPEKERPFRLPVARVWSHVAFYFCTLMSYWTGWSIVSRLALLILCGIVIVRAYGFFTKSAPAPVHHWRSITWLLTYFIGLAVLSYLGPFGGNHILSFELTSVCLLILSVVCLEWAVKSSLPAEEIEEGMGTL